MRTTMLRCGKKRALVVVVLALFLWVGGGRAEDRVDTIKLDWAYYNPVSLVLKEKGLLEEEFKKDGIKIGNLATALQTDSALIEKHLARHWPDEANAFIALNTAFFRDGLLQRTALVHRCRGDHALRVRYGLHSGELSGGELYHFVSSINVSVYRLRL